MDTKLFTNVFNVILLFHKLVDGVGERGSGGVLIEIILFYVK